MTNLYGDTPFMVSSGLYGRCRHGRTWFIPCWRCGVFHPLAWLRHLCEGAVR